MCPPQPLPLTSSQFKEEPLLLIRACFGGSLMDQWPSSVNKDKSTEGE